MQLQDAITLLNHNGINTTIHSWADLGCGEGLFTYALASLLPPQSIIYAVDKNLRELKKINSTDTISIKTIEADFIEDTLPLAGLDGILMANSLHYIKDKLSFIKTAAGYIKPSGVFLIVEYDTDKPVSTWVPYPVSFQSLQKIFTEAGYSSIQKIQERASVYNSGKIYSAIVR